MTYTVQPEDSKPYSNTGRDDAPYAALVCHPHPLGGGTMHNKVVYHAMKIFFAWAPRGPFNFRGVGLSEGDFDEGKGEQDDVRAALNWMEQPEATDSLRRLSFGSHVGLRACCCDPRVKALIGLGLPVHAEGRDYTYGFLPQCLQPKLFISGDHDPYGPRARWNMSSKPRPNRSGSSGSKEPSISSREFPAPNPKLSMMQDAIRTWLKEELKLSDLDGC